MTVITMLCDKIEPTEQQHKCKNNNTVMASNKSDSINDRNGVILLCVELRN